MQTAWLYNIVTPEPPVTPPDDDGDHTPPTTTTVMFRDVAVPTAFKGHVLSTEDDVRSFVEALATQLNAQVRSNNKIIL